MISYNRNQDLLYSTSWSLIQSRKRWIGSTGKKDTVELWNWWKSTTVSFLWGIFWRTTKTIELIRTQGAWSRSDSDSIRLFSDQIWLLIAMMRERASLGMSLACLKMEAKWNLWTEFWDGTKALVWWVFVQDMERLNFWYKLKEWFREYLRYRLHKSLF